MLSALPPKADSIRTSREVRFLPIPEMTLAIIRSPRRRGRGAAAECLDHVVVFGERHLRHVLLSYLKYYNEVRTHLSLEKDAPVSRAVERAGRILCRPVLGGHHLADINFR